MIYVRIVGGIGNALLRYAAARALAERNKTDLVIDLSWYRAAQTPPRRYVLDKLNTIGRFATPIEQLGLYQARQVPGRKAAVIRAVLPALLPNVRHIKETDMPFKQWLYDLKGDIYLDSDCFSERYFKDIQPILQRELTPREPTKFFTDIKRQMIASNAVALHIRRGDLVWNPKVGHGVLSLDYYVQAADYIASRHPNPTIFVFSDDLPWVKENLKLPYPMVFVEHPTEARDWEEPFLMATCKHQIIANSSFSWWGAWLNQNPEKIVCAPKRWYADPTHDTRDVVPVSWVRI